LEYIKHREAIVKINRMTGVSHIENSCINVKA